MSGPPPSVDTADLSLHFPLNTVALQRGGLVRSVMRRANVLAASGAFAAVWIEVLAYQQRLEYDVDRLKRSGHLHEKVRVRSVLYSLDDSLPPEVATTRSGRTSPKALAEPGIVSFPARDIPRTVHFMRDGILERSATRYPTRYGKGDLRSIDHFDSGRHRITREEYGPHGGVIRVLHYPPTHDQPTVARYLGRDGSCFLTVWQQPGEPEWSQVHLLRPKPQQLGEMGELYRYAFERLLASERSPVLFADFHENLPNLPVSNLDDIVRSVRHPGLRTVAMAHSNHHARPYTQDAPVSANWTRLLSNLEHWDLLVLLTDAQRADVRAHYGEGSRMAVIPPVAEPAQDAPGPVDPDRCVMVARRHPKKRVDEAVRAFRLVVDKRPSARLEIYGFGYGDREERVIDDLVDELGLGAQVHFGAFASKQSEIYEGACVTLLTSASEGFPLTILESMAHSCPVISYDTNFGPRDAIVDDVNGYLVPFGDQAALAERILTVMESADLRKRLGAGALATTEHFGQEEHVNLWREALAGLDGPPVLRSSLRADYEVHAARWLDGSRLELNVGVPLQATSPQLVVHTRASTEVQSIPVIDGQAVVDLGGSSPDTIFDFSLVLEPAGSERRLAFGLPHVVQHGHYLIYSTKMGNFSVKHLASLRKRTWSLLDRRNWAAIARRLRRR